MLNKEFDFLGTYKVRNEIETKRNEINENKRNQRNGNEKSHMVHTVVLAIKMYYIEVHERYSMLPVSSTYANILKYHIQGMPTNIL